MTDVDPDADTGAGGDEALPTTAGTVEESVHVTDPSEAFQALGNDVRTGILRAIRDRTDDEANAGRVSFSTLFETSAVDTTAGFAYHIDELVGPYLSKTEEGYALTATGRRAARAIESGTYTHQVDRQSVTVDDPCPFCRDQELVAAIDDNEVAITCEACERSILRMDFPPAGLDAHGDDLPTAFDRHHRHRIAHLGDGVCPECGGPVESRLDVVRPDPGDEPARESVPDPVQASFTCTACGYGLRCPVALTLLDHPEFVAFYHEHDESIDQRPIWNIGREWTETPLSHDPMAVRVAVTLDDETVECYVDGECTVVASRRIRAEAADTERNECDTTTAGSDVAPEADVA
ncbi:ArsR family transcriptional regulator [Halovivax asiaticus JCM 14624]|uniref:ArsR family transcriptional regulator n=1 Tax=Halovivax asiaticus JCM 14624 TaxID=1227490 RepID=M0BDM5_9EURY|nr:zinc ribbon domain-containing protein [Halovivax asiaticus]ELZ08403.1 ArsR family transcriptional regulator [Halovivax asiaticus JCM 14624]